MPAHWADYGGRGGLPALDGERCARPARWRRSAPWPRFRAVWWGPARCSTPEDVAAAKAAGARFGVSPGGNVAPDRGLHRP